MLPKILRTPIQFFPKNARSIFSDSYIVIKSHPNNLTYNRLGVIIGRRVLKSAVERNKLRRKTINFLGDRIKLTRVNPVRNAVSSGVNKGKDLLIILKVPIINLTDNELEEKFRKYEQFIK